MESSLDEYKHKAIHMFQKNYVVWKVYILVIISMTVIVVSEELCSMERSFCTDIYASLIMFQKNYVV